jgi:hypothetical protein
MEKKEIFVPKDISTTKLNNLDDRQTLLTNENPLFYPELENVAKWLRVDYAKRDEAKKIGLGSIPSFIELIRNHGLATIYSPNLNYYGLITEDFIYKIREELQKPENSDIIEKSKKTGDANYHNRLALHRLGLD